MGKWTMRTCGNAGPNCVVLAADPNNPRPLQLSSQAQTGLKIPSGQIAGGQFTIAAGQSKDLDVHFDACASIVIQGNGQYRLKPVLLAGEVSLQSNLISGQLVKKDGTPLLGLTAFATLQQKDPNTNVDVVKQQIKVDPSTGRFSFCPSSYGCATTVSSRTRAPTQIVLAVAPTGEVKRLVVTDGAGTVVVTDPEIVQGIGGRISGIVETSPIDEVLDAVGRRNVLDPEGATIDQFAGTEMAFQLGHKKVAVTVARPQDAKKIREAFGDRVALFAVHTTGLSEDDDRTLFESCDIISGCAAKWVRGEAKKRQVVQAGNKVPVYAVSDYGKMILEERLKQIGSRPEVEMEDTPRPLL